jgi:hypothetical protein
MNKFISTFSFLLLALAITAQSVTVPNFNGIKTGGNVAVTLVKGPSPKVDYTILKGNKEDLIIEVKSELLIVKVKGNPGAYASATKAKVTVYYQDLSQLKIAAGSTVSSEGTIKSEKLEIECSSGSSTTLNLDVDISTVSVSSGASLTIEGITNKLEAQASSGASMSASRFKAKNVDAQSSSGASMTVFASEKLIASASSGGSLSYKGSPKSKKIDSGSMSGGSVSGN